MSRFTALRLVVACALVAGVFSFPAPGRAAFPGENGPIAYRGANTRFGIFVVTADGTSEVRLTDLRFATKPDWSPDGSQIAFESEGDIFVMNSDGSGIRNLTNSPDATDGSPAWNLDGTRIVFDSARPSSDIFTMDTKGGNEVQLTTDTRFDGFPQWSPDGETISWAASRGSTPGRGIFTMPADTGEPETFVTPVTYNNPDHDWSPDGTRIVFDSAFDIFTVDRSGEGLTQLTRDGTSSFGVSWSPDGTRIAYRSDATGAGDIYVMDAADGANEVRVSTDRGNDTFPDWGPAPGPVPGCEPGPGTTCGTEGNDDIEVTVAPDATTVLVQTGSGADTITLEIQDPTDPATVLIDSGDGDDTITLPSSAGQTQVEVLSGDGDDVIKATAPAAVAARRLAQGGGAFGYRLRSGLGKDRIVAGIRLDDIDGGGGPDDVDGAGGADKVGGGGGNDKVEGGGGSDDLLGGGGADVLHGSGGANDFAGGSGKDTCLSDTRRDSFTGCERIRRNHRRNHQQA